jgi:hypothetical protein
MFKKFKTSFAAPRGVWAGDIDAHTACAAARVFCGFSGLISNYAISNQAYLFVFSHLFA